MPGTIEILPASRIDPAKWDQCIERSSNGLIYSRYEYLGAMCDNWSGIIIDDYAAVMALPWRKKWGITYCYETPFIQQLGLVGKDPTGDLSLRDVVHSFARYGDVLLNYDNAALARQLNASVRTNFVTDLSKGYDAVYAAYSKDLKYNLRRVQAEDHTYTMAGSIEALVTLFRSSYGSRFPHVTESDYAKFTRLCNSLSGKDMCFTRCIMRPDNTLLSAAVFLKDGKRIYNVMNTTTEAGRNTKANEYLIDSVTREFAGQPLLFDFEGSDIPGVKSFYEKFGATYQPYYHYHFNRLPWPLRLLKS